MKLITLNTWGGRLKKELEAFLREQMKDTDVFCFQEMFNASDDMIEGLRGDTGDNRRLLEETKEMLKDFEAYFCPVIENTYGMAIFMRKGIESVASGEVLIYENPGYVGNGDDGDHDRKMQWIHIKRDRKDFMILNVHGHRDLSAGKEDTPNRIAQSKAINEFIKTTGSIPKILVGDFNLNPDTESIKMLGEHVNNLVVEHGVTSTRTPHYEGEEKHADYIFVSSEVFVEKFEVMPDVVSDHAPLSLTFDVF